MALELKWRDERTRVELPKGYARVLLVEVDPGAQLARVHVAVYADAEARRDGHQPVLGVAPLEARGRDYKRLVEQVGGGGLVARCYAWLKKRDGFKHARDV